MKIALYVPCFIDRSYPEVARAVLSVLRRVVNNDWTIDVPPDQRCCGQPMYNMGCGYDALQLAEHFVQTFADYDAVVCPSASCTSMIRNHYVNLSPSFELYRSTLDKVYEFGSFMLDHELHKRVAVHYPRRVGIHQGCHGLRELGLGSCSEHVHSSEISTMEVLLRDITDIELVQLERPDECCGFGGSFAVAEEAVSCAMGHDRLADHRQAGAQVVTSLDRSCLMHLEGLSQRQGDGLKFCHVAEILAGVAP